MGKKIIERRNFLSRILRISAALGLGNVLKTSEVNSTQAPALSKNDDQLTAYNGVYEGARLSQIAFPLGGLGAGTICLGGAGDLTSFSLHHRPALNQGVLAFTAVSIKGSEAQARVLEGPVPEQKLRPQFPDTGKSGTWGLPRFAQATFEAQFPFAKVHLRDNEVPLDVTLTAWSPFSPNDVENASLPVAAIEYEFVNRGEEHVDAVFAFFARNFLMRDSGRERLDEISSTEGGFVMHEAGSEERKSDEAWLGAWVNDPNAIVNHAWSNDTLDLLWRQFATGEYQARPSAQRGTADGAALFVPLSLSPGQAKTIRLALAWYVPNSTVFEPDWSQKDGRPVHYPQSPNTYRPWYAGRFSSIDSVIQYWRENYDSLRELALLFSNALHDSTLPDGVLEAISANLSVLKSPTVLRQIDGRIWGWEGVGDTSGDDGGGYGTSTHVWNYAQALPHLFPALERTLRETELGVNQDASGAQHCRTSLPIAPPTAAAPPWSRPAADGQLGGIIKFYRDWRICGDTSWLRRWWPRIRASLDYCIFTWDPNHRGLIEEPHLTTYDEDFWGPEALCTGLYLGALKAAIAMGHAVGNPVELYAQLLHRGKEAMENILYNGEYFVQKVERETPHNTFMWESVQRSDRSSDWMELVRRDGPPFQYGDGCLSDGAFGAWLCFVAGVDEILDRSKVESHITSVYRHNFRRDLSRHINFKRATFACNHESGLLICSWPKGRRPSIPTPYSDEVWTGVEYQVASHLISLGRVKEGLDIVRSCRRRYDGKIRNPFDEVEAGHWYARAMSSYALLQAFSGARYDAVEKVLYIKPMIKGDFRCFVSTATGFGTVGVRNGQPFVEAASGHIPCREIRYTPA